MAVIEVYLDDDGNLLGSKEILAMDELEVPDWVDDEDAPSGNDTFDLMRSYRDEVEALSIENKALKTKVFNLRSLLEDCNPERLEEYDLKHGNTEAPHD